MNEKTFEDLFDRGELDSQYADFICDRYDAWDKEKMLHLWQDDNVYLHFKESMVAYDESMS